MPDYSRITVFILTPLIFRYHLPLIKDAQKCGFCVINLFPFQLATALFIGDVLTTFTYSIRFAYSRCENSHIQ